MYPPVAKQVPAPGCMYSRSSFLAPGSRARVVPKWCAVCVQAVLEQGVLDALSVEHAADAMCSAVAAHICMSIWNRTLSSLN